MDHPPKRVVTRRRGKRGDAPSGLVLTERDRLLFLLVGLHGYVSTAQIARELFPSEDRCRRRCRTLLDAGYLRVILTSSTSSNLITLTKSSLALIAGEQPEMASLLRLTTTIDVAGVDHHLGIVDARLYLVALTKDAPMTLHAFDVGPGAHPVWETLKGAALLPDGLATLAGPDGDFILAVEVDTGTESLGIIDDKLARYAPIMAAGQIHELWFVTTNTVQAGRRRSLSERLMAYQLGEVARLMPANHLATRPVQPPLGRVGAVP